MLSMLFKLVEDKALGCEWEKKRSKSDNKLGSENEVGRRTSHTLRLQNCWNVGWKEKIINNV